MFGLMLEPLQFAFGARDLRMIIWIAQRLERDQRIQHRRKNSRKPIAAFQPLDHPLLGLFQRAFPEGMNFVLREPFGKTVYPPDPQKEIPQREPLGVEWQRQIALVIALWIELIQINVLW